MPPDPLPVPLQTIRDVVTWSGLLLVFLAVAYVQYLLRQARGDVLDSGVTNPDPTDGEDEMNCPECGARVPIADRCDYCDALVLPGSVEPASASSVDPPPEASSDVPLDRRK